MQVLVGGMPAEAAFSTVVWQYRQSMPSPPAWCWWLNCTGCSRTVSARVMYGERLSRSSVRPSVASKTTSATMLPRA